MAGQVIPIQFRAQDSLGNAYSGAKLYTYVPGTTTDKLTYTTSALAVAHANPVVADANGVFDQVWASDNTVFDLVLKKADGTTVDSWLNVAALAIDTTGGITRDFGAGGRFSISGTGGTITIASGSPTGDDVGGAVSISGWEGTQADTIELDGAAVSVTGTFTVNGTLVSPSPISSGTVSAAAEADIALPAGYRRHEVTLMQVQPATDNQAINVRFSFDDGATYKAGASDYWDLLQATIDTAGGAISGAGSGAATEARIGLALSNGAGRNNTFVIQISTPDGESSETTIVGRGAYIRTGGNYSTSDFAGGCAAYGDADHIRVRAASGNISLRYIVRSF